MVERVCRQEVVADLADRMSQIDIAALRIKLRLPYTARIGIVDPGLPLVRQIDAESPAPVLTKRYVVPEVIVPPEPPE